MGRECKILMVEFFNSLMLVQSLHEVLGCSRYVDMPTGSSSLSVDRPSWLSTEPYRQPPWLRQTFPESWVLCRLAQSTGQLACRQRLVSGWFFKLDSEFVSGPNSEFLVFFSSWTL